MVTKKELLDYLHLQKYVILLELFIDKKVTLIDFEEVFILLRRQDPYWMSAEFTPEIEILLNRFFSDLDQYTPPELFQEAEQFQIDEHQLRNSAIVTLEALTSFKLC